MSTLVKSGWRDPLQTERTAYDILGLEPGARQTAVETAFRNGVAARENASRLTHARRVLYNASERALLDLFCYNPRFTSTLVPNPFENSNALELPERNTTVQSWENLFKADLSQIGTAHSLAVLWYWWAFFAENHRESSHHLAALEMWQNAIAYWAMITGTSAFWDDVPWPKVDTPIIRDALVEHLSRTLTDMSDRRAKESEAIATAYSQLKIQFANEIRVARMMVRHGIKIGSEPCACGPILLARMGFLETTAEHVSLAARKDKSNTELRDLEIALSPLSSVDMFIRQNQPDVALGLFECLPPEQRSGELAAAVRGEALYLSGKQRIGLADFGAGLQAWSTALKSAIPSSLRVRIGKALVAECQARAGHLWRHDHGKAISLLEDAIRIVDEPKLTELLAELLTSSAVQIFSECLEKQQTKADVAVVGRLKRGVAMLERANALGSRRAAEQLKTAEDILEQYVVGDSMRRAHDAAQRQDWDAAIRFLSEAMRSPDLRNTSTVKQNMAVCYSNRAVAILNRAAQSGYRDSLVAALTDLQHAVDMDPSNKDTRQLLATLEKSIRFPPLVQSTQTRTNPSRFIRSTCLLALAALAAFIWSDASWVRWTCVGFLVLYVLAFYVSWHKRRSTPLDESRVGQTK